MNRPELFLVSKEVLDACKPSEVHPSYKDMMELGIANLPYHEVDIGMNVHVYGDTTIHVVHFANAPAIEKDNVLLNYLFESEIKFRYRDGKCYEVLLKPDCPMCRERRIAHKHEWLDILKVKKYDPGYFDEAEKIKMLLVVLLASKNIVKTRTKDKLVALGIGRGKRNNHQPIYTTTLSLPTLSRLGESKETLGVTLRPHLRRGHIRRQKYGPGCEFTKSIWIEPCFVNADENFVSERSAYNASVKNMRSPGNEQDMQKL